MGKAGFVGAGAASRYIRHEDETVPAAVPESASTVVNADTPIAETPNTSCLYVSIDLGSDTLKIVFGYSANEGRMGEVYHYGKFEENKSLTQIGIPAVAFLSKKTGKWIYGSDVERSGEEDFTTVVQIKNLISLLASQENEEIYLSNKDCYFNGHIFPKYYLPAERTRYTDLRLADEEEKTFLSKLTPHDVCLGFFAYAKKIIEGGRAKLEKELGAKFDDVKYSVVYPSKVGAEYVAELEALVGITFSTKVYKSLSSVKALGTYAYRAEMVKDGESFLVFDIGEESISVAKVWFERGELRMDGVEGHRTPEALGGINIDEEIRRHIEDDIMSRETFATPPAGTPGHVNEDCLDSKKYQLLKDIKTAKHLLSTPDVASSRFFKNGVPLVICRDCYVQRYLTRENLEDYVGTLSDDEGSVADRINDYIFDEATRPINRNVKKILIAGGVIETLGLADYIRDIFKENEVPVEILTFDKEQGEEFKTKAFLIRENESSVYAAAVGGAIVAAENIVIKTVLSLSYGTQVGVSTQTSTGTESNICLSIFAEKGSLLSENEPTVFANSYSYTLRAGSELEEMPKDEILRSAASSDEIASMRFRRENDAPEYIKDSGGKIWLKIGRGNSDARHKAERWYGLETTLSSAVVFFYRGRRVKVRKDPNDTSWRARQIGFLQGITVDPSGRADMEIKVDCEENFKIEVTYLDTGRSEIINVANLEMDYLNKHSITVESNRD